MFLLSPTDDIADEILKTVALQPGISVGNLHAALRKKKIVVTLQHLYRKVNRLIDGEMLIKSKGGLTANLMWLSYLQYIAEEGKAALQKDKAQAIFPMKEGQRLVFKAESLNEVQTLWNHLLIQLHRAAPQKQLYKYYSHAWWAWNSNTLDVSFYKKIYENGVRCLWLYGNNTYLDRAAVQMYPDILDSRISLDAPFPAEGYNLNVYGDYVFECIFPEHIARHLDLVFHSVQSRGKDDTALIDDIFRMQAQLKVSVWRNAQLASKFRTQIGRYFLYGARKMPEEGKARN